MKIEKSEPQHLKILNFSESEMIPANESFVAVDMSKADEQCFIDIFSKYDPGCVVDARLAPRFDIGTLNRGKVFEFFNRRNVKYIDYTGRIGVTCSKDDRLNFTGILRDCVELSRIRNSIRAVVVVLFDSSRFRNYFVHFIP